MTHDGRKGLDGDGDAVTRQLPDACRVTFSMTPDAGDPLDAMLLSDCRHHQILQNSLEGREVALRGEEPRKRRIKWLPLVKQDDKAVGQEEES